MLKLLIIEDEKWEREGLMDFVDWAGFGIELSGAACDGIEGIEKARAIHPDIIITDIKMPGMDGLEMSKAIRAFLPDVKIIILTGYDDFQLAKEAINVNTHAYILKPIDEDEFMEALRKVIDECRNDAAEREKEKMLRKLLDESAASSRRSLLAALLKEKPPEELLKNTGVQDVLPAAAHAAVVAVGSRAEADADPASKDIYVDLDGCDKDLKTELAEAGADFLSAVCEPGVAVFVPGRRDLVPEGFMRRMAEIIAAYYEKKGVPAAAGIGAVVDEAARLHCSFRKAKEAMNFALFWKDRKVVEYSEVETLRRENASKAGGFLAKGNDYTKRLTSLLRSAAESSGANSLLDEMFQFIESNKWLDRHMVANFLYGLLNEASLLFYDINLSGRGGGETRDLLPDLPDLPDYQSLKEYVRAYFNKAYKILFDKKRKRDALLIEKVERIINERYHSDICLKTIAAEIYLSPNYLGSIFKKHTGIALSDYLCRLRMEKAKELLKSPKNNVSRVAKDVGIPNVSYFCRLFRKMFGVAPGKYQEMIIHGK